MVIIIIAINAWAACAKIKMVTIENSTSHDYERKAKILFYRESDLKICP